MPSTYINHAFQKPPDPIEILRSFYLYIDRYLRSLRCNSSQYQSPARSASRNQPLPSPFMPNHSEHAELAALRRQYQLILNSVGEGVYGLDLDGNVT
ncbi:MAG: hypothetical protein WA949_17795, partial [Phormidesmis sp.]